MNSLKLSEIPTIVIRALSTDKFPNLDSGFPLNPVVTVLVVVVTSVTVVPNSSSSLSAPAKLSQLSTLYHTPCFLIPYVTCYQPLVWKRNSLIIRIGMFQLHILSTYTQVCKQAFSDFKH